MRINGVFTDEAIWHCAKKSAAMPSDVRKAFGLPASEPSGIWAAPSFWGAAPNRFASWTEAQSASAHQSA